MKKHLIFIAVLVLFVSANESYAQNSKRKEKKKTTVVINTPRGKVVYVNPSPKVKAERILPKSTVTLKHKGTSFYFYHGQYYRYINGYYIVSIPPAGICITTLPTGHTRLMVAGKPYFYYQGAYYIQKGRSYEVVRPPLGITVLELPHEAAQISIDGKKYYEYDKTIYKMVETNEGIRYEASGYVE